MATVWVFLALATTHGWSLSQLDIKNAFLSGNIVKDVYMELHQGFVTQGEYPLSAKFVCKLQKSVYGLKQASKQWNTKFIETLV